MPNRLTVALILLLTSSPALGSRYPTALSFEKWTGPEGELIALEPGNRSSRLYRITALTRVDMNKPDNALQPLQDGNKVRTLDIKKELTSMRETRVKINYDTTRVAYLRVDHRLQNAHSYVDLDGEPIIRTGGGIPLWAVLLTAPVSLPIIAMATVALSIMLAFDPEVQTWVHSRTVPIPLDGKVHILKIGAGPNFCVAFRGWDAYYKLDTNQMKPGKVYRFYAHHWCDLGVGGYALLKTNALTVGYRRNGIPPLLEPGQVGWIDDGENVPPKTVQWASGHHSTLNGQPVPEVHNPLFGITYRDSAPIARPQGSSITFRDIRLKATDDPSQAPTIPEVARFTISTRHRLEARGGKWQQWPYYSDRQNRFNLWWCKEWRQGKFGGTYCANRGDATFEVVQQTNPQHLYLDPALYAIITKEEIDTRDGSGRRVRTTIYKADPRPIALDPVTVEETFRCVSGACSGP